MIALQRDAGLQTVTDGEFRRTSWHMDFIYSLGGIEQVQGETIHVQFRSAEGEYDYAPPAMRVTGTIGLPRDDLRRRVHVPARQRHAGPDAEADDPVAEHGPLPRRQRGDRPDVYPDIDAFWDDLTAAYAAQLQGVYDLGCRYLQLDDTSLAYINDPAQRAHIEAIGGDPDHLHEQYIANINRALADKPDDLVVTTHLCRGNNQSMWAAEGGYDFVAEALFGDLDVDGYFLEFDDERSGGFEPLRFVPKGKHVVLGLVTTKRPELEDADLLKRRIEEAAQYVDIDQLCLSRPVRLLLDRGGQQAHDRRAEGQARADRAGRRGRLGPLIGTRHLSSGGRVPMSGPWTNCERSPSGWGSKAVRPWPNTASWSA